ncbi:hypothetical protein JT359_14990 [Candidatus Poribacteria bacterium]|nr:hypothetical protein [Candidatus Poribacteria bacterium]
MIPTKFNFLIISFYIIPFIIISHILLGCGSDEINLEDNKEQIPSIKIERVPIEGSGWIVDFDDEELEKSILDDTALFRLAADPPPKNDLAIIVQFLRLQEVEDSSGKIAPIGFDKTHWVVIRKLKRNSGLFYASISHTDQVSVRKLPMISVIGKGRILDIEKLQKSLPATSYNGILITKDYDFPIYGLGDPSTIILDDKWK